jgi:hypothetical protein
MKKFTRSQLLILADLRERILRCLAKTNPELSETERQCKADERFLTIDLRGYLCDVHRYYDGPPTEAETAEIAELEAKLEANPPPEALEIERLIESAPCRNRIPQ